MPDQAEVIRHNQAARRIAHLEERERRTLARMDALKLERRTLAADLERGSKKARSRAAEILAELGGLVVSLEVTRAKLDKERS